MIYGNLLLVVSVTNIVWGFLSVIVFVATLLMTAVILIQDSKDTGLTSAFGGSGSSNALLGARLQRDLAKFTAYLAGILGFCLLVMSLITRSQMTQSIGELGAGGTTIPATAPTAEVPPFDPFPLDPLSGGSPGAPTGTARTRRPRPRSRPPPWGRRRSPPTPSPPPAGAVIPRTLPQLPRTLPQPTQPAPAPTTLPQLPRTLPSSHNPAPAPTNPAPAPTNTAPAPLPRTPPRAPRRSTQSSPAPKPRRRRIQLGWGRSRTFQPKDQLGSRRNRCSEHDRLRASHHEEWLRLSIEVKSVNNRTLKIAGKIAEEVSYLRTSSRTIGRSSSAGRSPSPPL